VTDREKQYKCCNVARRVIELDCSVTPVKYNTKFVKQQEGKSSSVSRNMYAVSDADRYYVTIFTPSLSSHRRLPTAAMLSLLVALDLQGFRGDWISHTHPIAHRKTCGNSHSNSVHTEPENLLVRIFLYFIVYCLFVFYSNLFRNPRRIPISPWGRGLITANEFSTRVY